VPAAQGKKLLAYALTEPEAGSDPMAMQSTFQEEAGGYVLRGTKYLISNGSVADVLIVFAYPQGRREGLCAFLVERETPGLAVAMKLTEKVGLFTSDTALLEFHNCRVPRENLLGPLGKGAHVAFSALANGRIGIAAGCVGVIEDCLNAVTERARQRTQHGKLIGKHQLVQRHIAQIAMDWEAARWPTYLAALKRRELDARPDDRRLRAEVDLQSALAKRIASERAWDAADRAVQVFGGFGYSLLASPGRHYCDTRVARIYEGTDEIMELKIAASVLGPEFEAYR
jgi:alkylation response protein AidB-like acyl-CoA dehydrogenase